MSEVSQAYHDAIASVDCPVHYQSEYGIECITAIEATLTPEEFRGFLKGNCLKYLWRESKKGQGKTDLAKSAWYLEKLQEHDAENGTI